MLYDDDDFIEKKPKLSAKKAQKKGLIKSATPSTDSSASAIVCSLYGGASSVLIDDIAHNAVAPISLMTQLTIGDRVEVDTSRNPIRILSIHPRRTELARIKGEGSSRHHKQKLTIAANIDIAVIVATATNPAFEPELVDRYIILCRATHLEPILCLNKIDLTPERPAALDWYRSQGLTIIETSPKTSQGMDELRMALKNKTAILLGKSGAGKSSLINILAPNADIKTQTLSEQAGQGQHTTTHSDIHIWAPNSYLIDTPGIRALDVSHVDDDDITLGFPDIQALAQNCHFADCYHEQEPDCAVREAVTDGTLPVWRWESYKRIKLENK